jgi:hypothetical protein
MDESAQSIERSLPPDQNQIPAPASSQSQTPNIFAFLDTVGYETDEFGRRIQSPQDGLDGMTLTSAGARILGNGLQVGAALGAEFQSETQHQRVGKAFAKLGELDQRLNQVSETLQDPDSNEPRQQAARTVKPRKKVVEQDSTDPAENSLQPSLGSILTHSLEQFDERVQHLEQQIGILPPSRSPHLDPHLSINQKIDRIEAAIQHLSDRLDRIEQWVEQNSVTHPQQPKIEGEIVAEKLQNFIEARAQHLDKSPQEPVVTTLGKLSLSQDRDSITLSIESDRYDEKFAATHTPEGWTITRNDLTSNESDRLLKLPQTPEAYRGWAASKVLISELSQSFPEQFNQESGVLNWEDDHAKYQMKIQLQADQSRAIAVERLSGDDRDTVLTARITPDRITDIDHSELNPDITEYQAKVLRSQRTHESKATHQLAQ